MEAVLDIDGLIVYLMVGLVLTACVVVPLCMLVMVKHKSMIELDHHGKFHGKAAAKSFVCPHCLRRSYAPSHIERRWCARCEKRFPERAKSQRHQVRTAD
jgi:hypothetical protein